MSNVDVKTNESNDISIFNNIKEIPIFEKEGIIPRVTEKLCDSGYSDFHCNVSDDELILIFLFNYHPYTIIFDKIEKNVVFQSFTIFPKILEPEFVEKHFDLIKPLRDYTMDLKHEENDFHFFMSVDRNGTAFGIKILKYMSPSIEWIENNVVQVMNGLHEVTIELNSVIEDVFKELMRELEENNIREVIG